MLSTELKGTRMDFAPNSLKLELHNLRTLVDLKLHCQMTLQMQKFPVISYLLELVIFVALVVEFIHIYP